MNNLERQKRLPVNSSVKQLIKEGVIPKCYFKYLITGTPRSATLYMALLFQSAGIPIPHEQYFGMPGGGFWLNHAIGDSSCIAVPFLERVPKGTKIIHIVRNPLKVLTALYRWQFLEDNDGMNSFWFSILSRGTMPSWKKFDGLDRYIHYYIGWNRAIECFTDLRYRVEDINKNPKKIFDDLGEDVTGKKLYRNTKTHSANIKKYLTRKDLKGCELEQDFLDYMKHLGY